MLFFSIRRHVAAYTCVFYEQQYSFKHCPATRANFSRLSTLPSQSCLLQRSFGQITKRYIGAQPSAVSTPTEPIPEYSFIVRPPQARPQPQSQIRQSLRAWSAQNEHNKNESIPDTLPYEGKITWLPNALYVNAANTEPRVEHDEIQDLATDEHSAQPGGTMIQPGTLMDYQTLLVRRQTAVYLGEIGTQSLSLLASGTWVAEKISQKRMRVSRGQGVVVPNFLTTEEIDLLKMHMPQRDVMRAIEPGAAPVPVGVTGILPDHVFAPILTKFKEFDEARLRFLRNHKSQLQHMYDSLAYEDAWRVVSVEDLPNLVLGVDYAAMTWASKNKLVEYANHFHPFFIAVQTAETLAYYIGPKKLHRKLKLVADWARDYQEAAAQAALGKNVSDLLRSNPLSSFIDKARRIIIKSRKFRTPTSLEVLGPSLNRTHFGKMVKVDSGVEFTEDDHAILDYLWDVAYRRPESGIQQSHASLIVRAVGAYPDLHLNRIVIGLLLAELGVVDPWYAPEDISVPLLGVSRSPDLERLHTAALESVSAITDGRTGATTFTDSMGHLRKDWGQLPALCIDRLEARNIEDALSIEPAQEISGGFWLHAHLAHPTSHFGTDHPVARFARKRGAAYYSPVEEQATQVMVPNAVIRQFSLRNGAPALTISTLLTKDGRVHDTKVVPGTLRNVVRLDASAVHKAMGVVEPELAVLLVGQVSKSPLRPDSTMTDSTRQAVADRTEQISKHLPQLKLMMELLTARRMRRRQEVETPANFPRLGISASTSVKVPDVFLPDRRLRSYHWEGDPGIILWGRRHPDMSGTSDQLRVDDVVAQSTRLAAETLGKWLRERNIPAVYLGNEDPRAYSVDDINEKSKVAQVAMPMYTRTSHARPLVPHNMKQYAGCTSPLRRYMDMINHFQVDSYLKAESQGLISKTAPVRDDSILAFSKSGMDKYLAQDAHAGDALDELSRETSMSWAFRAIFRAFHFKEAEMPEVMEVIVANPARHTADGKLSPASGHLVPWSLPVELEEGPEGYDKRAQIHEFIPVKIINVHVTRRVITARAIGPSTKTQQILQPIMCYQPGHILDRESNKPSSGEVDDKA